MSADLPAESPNTTEPLIQRCLRGDQTAWEAIVRRHRRKVFNVAYKFVGKHDEAEDLTQDIFLKVFRSLDTFDHRANLCIDHYSSVRKERETFDPNVDPDALSPVSHEEDPVAALEQQDRAVLLHEAMATLPETL